MKPITETICAPATPAGRGAVSMIRISGPATQSIVSAIFSHKQRNELPARQALFGSIHYEERLYDEVVLLFYPGPKSYTTEDMAEIFCHGNPIIVREILLLLNRLGARLAHPGEFTEQAFWGGRVGLTQAEAIDALIRARSQWEIDLWLKQTRNDFREQINELRAELIDLLADLEAEIDFADETDFSIQTSKTSEKIYQQIQRIIHQSKIGQKISEGMNIALIGRPNVGKSSLMNLLLNQERSIVSAIPGTTRDVITESIEINGLACRFFDTAGLHKQNPENAKQNADFADFIEEIGMQKTRQTIEQAHLILFVYEAHTGLTPEDKELIASFPDRPVLYLANKADLLTQGIIATLETSHAPTLFISAKQGTGLDSLIKHLTERIQQEEILLVNEDSGSYTISPDNAILLQERAVNLLHRIAKELAEFISLRQQGYPPEIQTEPLRATIEAMGELTGQIHTEDILGSIFRRFCIGK